MIASVFLYCAALSAPNVLDVVVDRDNMVIRASCRVIIPDGTIIEDLDGNGVIQIDADRITIEFAPGSVLTGNANLQDRDLLSGVGIRIDNRRGVTIKNPTIRGYKVGLWASQADGLKLENASLNHMYSRRLLSTPEAEDSSDWFYPHHNDERPWRTEYGGAIVIERSKNITLSDCLVREGQSGIILDRVENSRIYGNDCSFLSGWGLAMWRSSNNTVSRNAFDFCIRGYSHGVYNRGQDSAGILMFEQCSKNTIIENSITHGGDGIFGFAGREAIGEVTTPGMNHAGLGCNDNIVYGNDLSYAAAHGFEMTFSHRNIVARNRFVENAICGIWGGYSQDMIIADNEFKQNGSSGYGLERGGINIEHGSGNQIIRNNFAENAVAIHLWWDDDGKLLAMPGVKATYRGVSDNLIAANRSLKDEVFLRVRDVNGGKHIKNLQLADNRLSDVEREYDIADGISFARITDWKQPEIPTPESLGTKHPVGARTTLRGRHNIIMTQWGPWDHTSPLVRVRPIGTREVLVDVLEPSSNAVANPTRPEINAQGEVIVAADNDNAPKQYKITPKAKGRLTPYKVDVSLGTSTDTRAGVLLDTQWKLIFFAWDKQSDPRENLEAWKKLAASEAAIAAETSTLSLKFGHGGPRTLKLNKDLSEKGPGNDHFGMLAQTKVIIPKGDWKFITQSDDGIRVKINGNPLIENWTWHAPTKDEAVHHQDIEAEVLIEIEYFEIDGFATLDLEIVPATK